MEEERLPNKLLENKQEDQTTWKRNIYLYISKRGQQKIYQKMTNKLDRLLSNIYVVTKI